MLSIEYLPIDAITPYDGNAKEHPESQVDQIVDSIRQFGFNDPIAIDENGTLIEGHGRLLAARKMGLDTVPVIRIEGLTDEQKRAYTLVHNQLTMNSGFDLYMLQEELSKITEIDMQAFDFEIGDTFSMDDMVVVDGYSKHESTAEYFESAFVFPSAMKEQITSYLRKHKQEITEQIINSAKSGKKE